MDILPKNFLLSLDQGEVRRPIAARRGRLTRIILERL
jgi:hypothetical protein